MWPFMISFDSMLAIVPAVRQKVAFVSACGTAAARGQITASSWCFYLLNSCFPVIGVITPQGTLLCSVVLGTHKKKKRKEKQRKVFRNVKLGVQNIQVAAETILVVPDSELFSRRYLQTVLHAPNPRWEPRGHK